LLLREECAVLKRELESLRQVAGSSSPRKNQKNESDEEAVDWAKKLEETSAKHLAVSQVDLVCLSLDLSLCLSLSLSLSPGIKLCPPEI
jgi:hypothetical protein